MEQKLSAANAWSGVDDRPTQFMLSDAHGKQVKLDSVRALHEFLLSESQFWKSAHERVHKSGSVRNRTHRFLANTFGHMGSACRSVESWLSDLDSWDDDELKLKVNSLQSDCVRNLNNNWLWSGHEYVEPFICCVEEDGENSANAFLEYLVKNSLNNPQHIESFNGILRAYEFKNQNSGIVKRRNGEKASLGRLRNEMSDAKYQLFSEIEEERREFAEWREKTIDIESRFISVAKYLRKRQEREHQSGFNDQLASWTARVQELEQTYEESLKLSKPAKYWAKSAKKYGLQGGLWTLALVALVVVGLLYFREFFLVWLDGKQLGLSLSTIQGVVIFGTLVATYAFLLKTLSRLVFSSYHLMRDAEEREQLTYLYLSLSHEAVIDVESRSIVLQALFSRTETGLLTHEHGPTMPSVGDAIKLAARAKSVS